MQSNSQSIHWLKLQSLYHKFNIEVSAFMNNDSELIIADDGRINKYNVNLNKWTSKSTQFKTDCKGQQFDDETNCLYSYHEGGLDKLNLNMETLTLTQYKISIFNQIGFTNCCYIKIPSTPFHLIISGYYHPKHEIWNEDNPKQSPKMLHQLDFTQFPEQQPRGIYIKSTQQILVFGGFSGKCFDTIWRYSVINNIWDLLDCKIPIRVEAFDVL